MAANKFDWLVDRIRCDDWKSDKSSGNTSSSIDCALNERIVDTFVKSFGYCWFPAAHCNPPEEKKRRKKWNEIPNYDHFSEYSKQRNWMPNASRPTYNFMVQSIKYFTKLQKCFGNFSNYLRSDDSNFGVVARLAEWHRHEPMCVDGKFGVNCARDENDDVACDFL